MKTNMIFWKNPGVSKAKALAKMPEYNIFIKRQRYFDELHMDKNLRISMDSFKPAEGNGVRDKLHGELASRLEGWPTSCDAIFLKEIEKTKGELAQDAKSLLEKAEIKDEKSPSFVLLEKTGVSSDKIAKRISIAGWIGVAATVILGATLDYLYDISDASKILLPIALLEVPSAVCIIVGTELRGRFDSTLRTLKDAISIVKGESKPPEYGGSTWDFE